MGHTPTQIFSASRLALPAGSRLTLSPQPQAPFWFGLLNTNCDGELVGLVVHLGAEQIQHGLRIDDHARAVALDDLVELADAVGPGHGVLHAGAAALLDADLEALDLGSLGGHQGLDARARRRPSGS